MDFVLGVTPPPNLELRGSGWKQDMLKTKYEILLVSGIFEMGKFQLDWVNLTKIHH